MKDAKKALIIAVGAAVLLPILTVVAFEAGPFGFVFVGALFVLVALLVVYADLVGSTP